MSLNNKELLLAKIDTLYYSIADPQLQSVVGLLRDVVAHVDIDDKGELGFGKSSKTAE